MRRGVAAMFLSLIPLLFGLGEAAGRSAASDEESIKVPMLIDMIPITKIDGTETTLAEFKGHVLLIVNVASECGFTDQYSGLQELYEKYADRGFAVLGFPANNFQNQEPGSNEKIAKFCRTTFGVTFPMFEKISVLGEDMHPLYQHLTSKDLHPDFGGDIGWNFTKFILNRDGKVVARFSSAIRPTNEALLGTLEQALAERRPESESERESKPASTPESESRRESKPASSPESERESKPASSPESESRRESKPASSPE